MYSGVKNSKPWAAVISPFRRTTCAGGVAVVILVVGRQVVDAHMGETEIRREQHFKRQCELNPCEGCRQQRRCGIEPWGSPGKMVRLAEPVKGMDHYAKTV